MGLKTNNYVLKNCGITLDTAYAQIGYINIEIDGTATAEFLIQQNRTNITTKELLDTIYYRCKIDKELPVHKQIYEKAKVDIFTDWSDDIIS